MIKINFFYKSSNSNKFSKRRTFKKNGYTFAELLAVLLILGLLAAIITPQILKQMERAKVKAAKIQAQTILTSIELMASDIGHIPTQEQGLDLLISPPSDAYGWQGPYLKDSKRLIDPWGNKFQYKLETEESNSIKIISFGSDGKEGGKDAAMDIVEQ